MSQSVTSPTDPSSVTDTRPTTRPTPRWLASLDSWCERVGDAINPILVKETRQALKSRQFVVTFSLMLFAALGWTVAGSLSLMPQIYTSPSAPRMMIGYYIVLALPMLMVVPLAAYRSLESEIDDGTLELLSITALSPWQIVLGKLASASLQMLLYFVTLFPCLAFAYSLRGVDLPTTLVVVVALAVTGLTLTVAGLFFAPLAQVRSGRIFSQLVLLGLLLGAEYGIGAAVIGMIYYGNPFTPSQLMFILIASTAVAGALSHLLLTATAAQLTPETENRSTALRLSLVMFTFVAITVIALSMLVLERDGIPVYGIGMFVIAGLWTVCGALMVSENSVVTPRIRRELPSSFLARLTMTWLTPGPATGLVFTITAIVVLTLMQQASMQWLNNATFISPGNRGQLRSMFQEAGLLFPAYLVSFLVVVRGLIALIRIKSNPRVEVGIAALTVVALMAALVPYSLQLHFNDYQPLNYDARWQMTNWIFTIGMALDRSLPPGQVANVVGIAFGFGSIALIHSWRTTRPRRIATPKRVTEARAKKVDLPEKDQT